MLIRNIFTLLIFILLVFLSTYIAKKLIKKNFLISLPVGFAILLTVEACFLNFLSLFYLVSFTPILILNIVYVIVVIKYITNNNELKSYLKEIKKSFIYTFKNPYFLLCIPILAIILFSALVYAPNNWDSMTYHMGRVIHWIQNHSVNYYETNIKRQILFPPGAEYLILIMQLLSGGDYLAALIQYFSFFILIISLPRVLRSIGFKKYSNLIYILVTSIPMCILQASSTQNDLVSAVMMCSVFIIILDIIVFPKQQNLDIGKIIALGICLNAAYLVKPTGLFVLFPFAIWTLIILISQLIKNKDTIKKYLLWASLFIVISLIISGPETYRRFNYLGSDWTTMSSKYGIGGVYEKGSDKKVRLLNSVENLSFHKLPYINNFIPSNPENITAVFNYQEDFVGNGIHLQLIILCIIFYILLFPYLSVFQKIFLPTFIFSWIVTNWYIPWMPWNSRLQTPFFVSSIFLITLLNSKIKNLYSRIVHKTFLIAFVLITFVGFIFSFYFAVNNLTRPLSLSPIINFERDNTYYNFRGLKAEHDFLINLAKEKNVKEIGFYCGEDDYDYPLTYRAYREGILVKQIEDIDKNINKYELFYCKRNIKTENNLISMGNNIYSTKK